ncbi:MAG: flagellar basal body L-ring protein FlgH [Steroidobacter sp.]
MRAHSDQVVKTILVLLTLMIAGISAADQTPRSFFADRTAKAPGDTLTVIISELASTTTTATTKLAKTDKAGASLSSPELGTRNWSGGLNSDFSGGGEIDREGRFIAKLAVTVKAVDAQGNLHVEGEQEIVVNREKQHLRLTGVVRQEDLAADNTIESWRIRDAHIEFVGSGDLAKKQTPGLITRILSWFGIV